ncbi:MAG TPA: stage III sporulation protein AF [Clostridia bacterium]
MIDFLKSWVMNISALVILLVLFEIILPSGKIKKFINLVTGFVLIIAIVTPILKLSGYNADITSFRIMDSNFLDKKELSRNADELKSEQIKEVTDIYRKNVIGRIEEELKDEGFKGVKADLIINEDYKNKSYGEIKRVYIYFDNKEEMSGIKPVEKIQRISPGQEVYKIPEGEKLLDDKTKKRIEDRISKLFEIKKEDIVINGK